MRAVVYTKPGGLDVIEVRDVPDPVPGSDDILIDVAYAGLNRADILQRQGRYGAFPTDRPMIPGMEYAGTVAATGAHVTSLHKGDRVFGLVVEGAQAERLVAPAASACVIPDGLSFTKAGAVPEAFMTAWDALTRAGLTMGDTVIVHAIGSSVGLAALALVKRAGGQVLGTSRTSDKLERAQALGADRAVLFDDDWPVVAHEMSGGRGADIILDFVGLATFERNVAALAPRGRIVQIGTLAGAKGEIALGSFMAKCGSYLGTMLRMRPLHEKVALARDFSHHVVPALGSEDLAILVDRAFALDEVRDAQRYMEENRNFGKIVLAVTPDA
jgi:NADPH2:quinone reductase